MLLLDRVNKVWCQLQYYYQTRANFVTSKTSTNNGDNDNNNDGDSNGFNKGDNARKICIQDKPNMLVNIG